MGFEDGGGASDNAPAEEIKARAIEAMVKMVRLPISPASKASLRGRRPKTGLDDEANAERSEAAAVRGFGADCSEGV